MQRSRICAIAFAAAVGLALHAAALAQGTPQASCSAAASRDQPLANRSDTIASMERLPEGCLKTLIAQCSDTASRTVLDLGTAAICSMGYEALLRKGFGGNFPAMLAWWERDRSDRLIP